MSFECINHIHNHPGSKNNLPLKRVSVPCQVYPDGIFQDAYRPVRQNISQQWQRCKIAKMLHKYCTHCSRISRCSQACLPKYFTTVAMMQNCKKKCTNVPQNVHLVSPRRSKVCPPKYFTTVHLWPPALGDNAMLQKYFKML